MLGGRTGGGNRRGWTVEPARLAIAGMLVSCFRAGEDVSVYHRLKNVPELEKLSCLQRMRVLRKAGFRDFILHQKAFWVGCLIQVVCVLTGDFIGLFLEYRFGASERVHYACGIIGILIGGLFYSEIYYRVLVERFRPVLRNWLATHPVSN